MPDSSAQLASDYHTMVHAADAAPVRGEPEAQLTTPVANLLQGLARQHGLGDLRLIRETPLGRTRPDFAALLTRGRRTTQRGFIELKAPGVGVDPTRWTGRNATQWERMSADAEILIVCDGTAAQLFCNGHSEGLPATLPFDGAADWDDAALTNLLRRFLELTPTPVINVTDLSRRLAVRTADLRDRLLWLMGQEDEAAREALNGHRSWAAHVDPHATRRDFADGSAQVVAYGMVLAALSTDANRDQDGHITVGEARKALRGFSPVMAAAFAPLIDRPALASAVEAELGALETLISAIDRVRVNLSADARGEPWLYFYEDFLSIYDPEARRQAGVYYTPVPVVRAMVRIVDHLLVHRLGRRLGFADRGVVTLDPAAGTGTFPLSVIDRAVQRAVCERGPAGEGQAADNLSETLYAFELLPGPYSVAHLRLTQRLRALGEASHDARVILTDTLESPLNPPDPDLQFGDAQVLAAEQNRSVQVKLDERVTVVIGNPPYRRVAREEAGRGSGGWVLDGRVPGRSKVDQSLFDDVLDVAKAHTIFSHHASLYNLYVYFWRWAIWKAFEAHGDGPGVVAFITASSWLTGPGFVGLRQLVRELCDEVWVIDLGGDNHGANPEENVFAIETPVAVVVMMRSGGSDPATPATVHYKRVSGGADDKLSAMSRLGDAENPLSLEWQDASNDWLAPFKPATGAASWGEFPALTDLFPWQQPGCKFGRTWPIAPDQETLRLRWRALASAKPPLKPALFATASTGRTVSTKVGGLPTIAESTAQTPEPLIKSYAYRSFDRQWAFHDPRLAALERPSLWQSCSDKQVFLTSLLRAGISKGPALTASVAVPDLHHYRGSFGGKDVVPLYRDAAGTQPNLTGGLAASLAETMSIPPPSVEDVAAYTYALLSASNYQERFAEELRTPGLRVPMTADPSLWSEAVAHGRYLLWLHSYAERFRDDGEDRGSRVPDVDGLSWTTAVRTMPADMTDIAYNAEVATLMVGDGMLVGVIPDVWSYSVSGMQVLAKWLGYRTVKGTGRAATSDNVLDRIRPTNWTDEWNDELLDLVKVLTHTLDRQPRLADLLDRVCHGPLIQSADLPMPRAAERKVPATESKNITML